MSRYSHFTTKERESLPVLIKTGKKNSEIAKQPGRSPSTISREIRRNVDKRESYSAVKAEEQYLIRRKNIPSVLPLPKFRNKVLTLLLYF